MSHAGCVTPSKRGNPAQRARACLGLKVTGLKTYWGPKRKEQYNSGRIPPSATRSL
jgi:hypothetical protein